jgi:hypothetical protein
VQRIDRGPNRVKWKEFLQRRRPRKGSREHHPANLR